MGKKAELVEAARVEFAGVLPSVERWHALAVRHSRISIWCAACCGHELMLRKKEIGHGGWMKFLKVLPFSDETARKYMDLAVEWKAKTGQIPIAVGISEDQRPKLLEGVNHSTIELTDAQITEISDGIHQAVGETTLRQLYFEWGICKPPHRPGGNMRKDGAGKTTPTEDEIHETYAREWAEIVDRLTTQGRRQRTHTLLTDGEIEAHRAGLAYVLAELDDEIGRRKQKKGKG